MFRLRVKSHFDSAHYILNYNGKCQRVHGHRFEVELTLEGEELDDRNILVDFAEIKRALEELIDDKYDHYVLNMTLNESNVTAEFLARQMYNEMRGVIPPNIRLTKITVWESPDCCVEYNPERALD